MFGPVEPSADIRKFSIMLFELYTANLNVGFTEEQAMDIVLTFVEVQLGKQT